MEYVRGLQEANKKYMERIEHATRFAKHLDMYGNQVKNEFLIENFSKISDHLKNGNVYMRFNV